MPARCCRYVERRAMPEFARCEQEADNDDDAARNADVLRADDADDKSV